MDLTRSSLGHFTANVLNTRGLYYVIFWILLLIQLCPIWFTAYPAMHDYPNHLARAHILSQYNEIDSYRTIYERDWQIIPNLAVDIIIPALLNIVSIETASKIFLSLMVVLFNVGIHALGFAIDGRPRWTALAATFFTYNFAVSYGFVNYVFGLGLFFLTLATWLRMRDAWTIPRILLMTLLTLLCYVSHLSSFIFLGITAVALTLAGVAQSRMIQRHHVMGLLPFAPATVIHLLYTLTIQHSAPMSWWHPLVTKKLIGLLYPFISYNPVLDFVLSLTLVLLLIVAYAGNVARPTSKEFVLIGSLFLGLYFLAPMSGGTQSTYVDRRFLLPAVVCLIVSLRIEIFKPIGRYVMIGLLIVSIARAGGVWKFWSHVSQEIESQVHVLDRLPDGVRLYPMFVHDKGALSTWLWDMHFFYAAHYATIYRHAFVPTLYAWDSLNPLHLRTRHTGYAQTERGTPVERIDWGEIFSEYDYLWGYKLSDDYKQLLLTQADLVAQAGEAMLFRIRKGVSHMRPLQLISVRELDHVEVHTARIGPIDGAIRVVLEPIPHTDWFKQDGADPERAHKLKRSAQVLFPVAMFADQRTAQPDIE